jgi:hypothetical protein
MLTGDALTGRFMLSVAVLILAARLGGGWRSGFANRGSSERSWSGSSSGRACSERSCPICADISFRSLPFRSSVPSPTWRS